MTKEQEIKRLLCKYLGLKYPTVKQMFNGLNCGRRTSKRMEVLTGIDYRVFRDQANHNKLPFYYCVHNHGIIKKRLKKIGIEL